MRCCLLVHACEVEHHESTSRRAHPCNQPLGVSHSVFVILSDETAITGAMEQAAATFVFARLLMWYSVQ